VEEVPGRGGTVTTFSILYGAPIPARDQNRYWQELETRLGVTWEPSFAPQAEYGERVATLLAGGDFPDLFYVNPGQGAAQLYQALEQGAFTDLTDYLSGSALAAYPNLARLPDFLWRNVAFRGRIYGVPKAVPRIGSFPFYRGDWAETLGIGAPTNADEAAALLTAMATGDPDRNGSADTWGLGGSDSGLDIGLATRMFRVPNQWRLNPDGTLTAAVETEEFRQAIAYSRRLYEAGAYHPDSLAMTFQQARDAFLGGRVATFQALPEPFFGAQGIRGTIKTFNPAAEVVGLIPPGHDGGRGVTHSGEGFFGFTAIPTASGRDEARIQELLRILDYLLAPFGSEEQIFREYGLEGVHHTVGDDGARELTERGELEIGAQALVYLVRPEGDVYFYPGVAGEAEYAQDLSAEAVAIGIDDPTLGLYSPTETEEGDVLTQLEVDAVNAVISGREPLEALERLAEEWRARGGDRVRQEYQEALAAS
jgi:putative aldouronate transport system substrate-binding protein